MTCTEAKIIIHNKYSPVEENSECLKRCWHHPSAPGAPADNRLQAEDWPLQTTEPPKSTQDLPTPDNVDMALDARLQ